MIGGVAPSQYLQKIQHHKQVQLNDDGMNALLESHLINAQTLRADDFDAFYADRKIKLLALIERIMGKPALGLSGIDEPDEEDELPEAA
jgi:hypothetical protein